MRLIDADELTTILDEESQKDWSWSKALLIGFAKQILSDAPTVDAVEVVRCKDCKHYWKNPSMTAVVCLASPKDDAFCSEGERRKDETD